MTEELSYTEYEGRENHPECINCEDNDMCKNTDIDWCTEWNGG